MSRKMMNFLVNFIKLIRLPEWLDKIWLLVLSFVFLQFLNPSASLFLEFIILLIYFFSLLSFGFLLNSYFEKEIDLFVGKDRGLGLISQRSLKVFILLLFLIIFIMPFYFKNIYIVLLNLLIIILTIFYSAPPLYFKNRPVLGIIVPSLLQGPLIMIYFVWLQSNFVILIYFISLWMFIINVYMQLIHQFIDYENDIKTNLHTFAAKKGKKVTIFYINLLLFFMFLFLVIPLFLSKNLYQGLFISFLYLIYYLPSLATFYKFKYI